MSNILSVINLKRRIEVFNYKALRSVLKSLSITVFCSLIFSSCGGDSAENKTAKHGLQIRMHDFPIQDKEISKVIIEINKIEAHHAGLGWITLSESVQKYNLLELQDGASVVIFDSPMELGKYTQIRLVLNENNEIFVENRPYRLSIPSGEQTGVKLITPFEIIEGQMVEVTLDFDAEKSVHFVKGQGFL